MQVAEAFRVMRSSLRKDFPSQDDGLTCLNDAWEWFAGAHDWTWLLRGPVPIDARATITVANASWTANTKRLQKANAFTAYVPLVGDQIFVTSGTGAGVSLYNVDVAATIPVLPSSIILETSIGPDASDIGATMRLWWASLPADFGEFVPGFPRALSTSVGALANTDLSTIHDLRAARIVSASTLPATNGVYYWSLSTGRALTGGVAVDRMDFYPEISAGQKGAFAVAYRAKALRLTTDTTEFDVPYWCAPAFREVLRHFARGYEEEDEGTASDRLAKFIQGPIWGQALDQDMRRMPNLGQPRGGALAMAVSGRSVLGPDFTWPDPS